MFLSVVALQYAVSITRVKLRSQTVSSIGEEKEFNPRLGSHTSREDYIQLMNSLVLDKPKLIEEAVPANLACGLVRQDGE